MDQRPWRQQKTLNEDQFKVCVVVTVGLSACAQLGAHAPHRVALLGANSINDVREHTAQQRPGIFAQLQVEAGLLAQAEQLASNS
jgi:hypothetical protein